MKPFFDILTQLAKEHNGTKHLIAEYEASLTLMKEQKKLVNDLIPFIEDGNLTKALESANKYLPPPDSRNPLAPNPCPDPAQCPEEKQGLKKLYDSWESTVKLYIDTITNYQNQTTPDLDGFLAQLKQESEGLKQQIDLLPKIIDQMKEIQKNMTDADAALILDPDFSFYNFNDEVWRLLSTYFPKVFNINNTSYYISKGTNYRVCINMTYDGQLPAEPQTVCSTISYDPSFWTPNTGFAKSCTTFTPQ